MIDRFSVLASIETRSLSKRFGDLTAVDQISFSVEEGEIFGFLGPNGAGKSTTMMILTTLLKPTSGSATVAGYDVVSHPKKVRENIGFVQQEITVDEYLTGRENLLLQAKLNHIPKEQVSSRIDSVLELIDLSDKQDQAVITYSGGMRKRLDIAGGLLHRPRVLFLDEPTVGLDIQTRRKIWEYVKDIHKEYEMTIFLSTHYMEEADQLCDRIAIMDYGKIQAIDKPEAMKSALGAEVITIGMDKTERQNDFIERLHKIPQIKEIKTKEGQLVIFASEGTTVIPKIFQITQENNVNVSSLSLTRPTLDDVFISYTGRELRDESAGFNRRKEHAKMRKIRA